MSLHNLFRYFVDLGQTIRGSGENEIIWLLGVPKEPKNVILDDFELGKTKILGCFTDKLVHDPVFFHDSAMERSPGSQLVGNAPGTSKKVQGSQAFQLDIMLQNIKQSFLGDIGGRPGKGHFGRRVHPTPTQ
jgi:hypothetical protein